MHNRMAITPRRLWHAICDYDLWPVSASITKETISRLGINESADICNRPDSIYPPNSAGPVPHFDPQESRLQYSVYYQPIVRLRYGAD